MDGFLDWASAVEVENKDHHPDLLSLLKEIEELFRSLLAAQAIGGAVPLVLLMNSYGSLLAAIRVALGGHSPPTFMILRGCLESAAYALLATDPPKAQVYLNRNSSQLDKNNCAELFTFGQAMKCLPDQKLARIARFAYNNFIDFGAHPNAKSIFNHLKIAQRENGLVALSLTFLYDSTSSSVVQTLMACLETAIVVLYIAQYIFPVSEHAKEAAGIANSIEKRKNEWLRQNNPDAYQKTYGQSGFKSRRKRDR